MIKLLEYYLNLSAGMKKWLRLQIYIHLTNGPGNWKKVLSVRILNPVIYVASGLVTGHLVYY